MDHPSPTHACCSSFSEKRRKIEPYVFFVGVVLLVALGIVLLVCESQRPIGPRSAQSAHSL